jgi:hypothetical protein
MIIKYNLFDKVSYFFFIWDKFDCNLKEYMEINKNLDIY